MPHNKTVSAAEVIEQIKELPANEREQVVKFVMESSAGRRACSVATEKDGLPVIHANGGTITSQMVRDIEGFAP